jgi:hypothetical protein
MIVISILTALGLEHLITSHHHVRAAEQAQRQIVAELRTNLEEVRSAREQNAERLKPLVALETSLKQDLQAGASKATINQHLLAQVKGHLYFGFILPTLRHEAWDVVVANQAATHIEAGALWRYSAAYASQRESMALANQSSSALLNGPRLFDAMTDLELQKADPLEVLRVLRQVSFSLSSTQINLKEIQTQLESSLKGEPAAPPETGTTGGGH